MPIRRIASSIPPISRRPTPTPNARDQPTFASLGVDPALVKALAGQGITTTFAIQAMTVADALAGRDVCGKAKTGSGKTLAFGVPLLQRTMATRSTEPGRPRALVLVRPASWPCR